MIEAVNGFPHLLRLISHNTGKNAGHTARPKLQARINFTQQISFKFLFNRGEIFGLKTSFA